MIAIAFGLAMDAFAVAISSGCQLQRASLVQLTRMSCMFALFQGGLAIFGWLAGQGLAKIIAAFAPWLAFGLLLIVAVHMVISGVKGEPERSCQLKDPTQGWTVLGLALATSIDAFAVGTSLSLLSISIWLPSLFIALAALWMTAIGLLVGCRLGDLLGKRMEIIGGLVLLYIAVRTLDQALL